MEFIRSDPPPGSWAVADEIGSWMPARDYMTLANKLLSLVLETWRYKRLGVIWTVPQMRQADINIRTMANISIETIRVMRAAQEVRAKMKYIEINSISGDIMRKFPVIQDDNNLNYTITDVYFDRPPKELEKLYLDKKETHMEEFYAGIHHQLRGGGKEKVKNEQPESNVTCHRCSYDWFTKSKKIFISCPSCGSKTRNTNVDN